MKRRQLIDKKPILSVLVDNSASIKYFKKDTAVNNLVTAFKTNQLLNEKFTIDYFSFDNSLHVLDSMSFIAPQTDIYSALQGVEDLRKKNITAPVVLISDGNQTTGSSYEYYKFSTNIYPIVIGDTAISQDIKITRVNVNKYSHLNNKFPIECKVLYEGKEAVTTQFHLFYKGKVIFKKTISFTEQENVQTITTAIRSSKEGIQYYTASVGKLKDEKNTNNNHKIFSVEVLNKQAKVLILSSIFHPDLGALKRAIETNKQRFVTLKNSTNKNTKITDYKLVILYQPNKNFKSIFKKLKKQKSNYFVITGAQTDWNFLNKIQSNFSKNYIEQIENYGATLNKDFLTFRQKEIAFSSYPPLKDIFGNISINTKHDALLYQNIMGIKSDNPLLAFFEDENQKSAVLFGENSWKWRAASFLNTNSFQDFDAFISNCIQYLTATKNRERLSVTYEHMYLANTPVSITASYLDKNFQFDGRALLNLKLTNVDTNISQNVPFSLRKKSFEVIVEGLPSGDYEFNVLVEGQEIARRGTFKITKYQIEEQFSTANANKLAMLAGKTGGKLYSEATQELLIDELMQDSRYFTTQKEVVKNKQLIEWQLLLFVVVFLLSLEWFVRKYYGKI
ncbi:MAG: VWA domain-containing protein [Polaribacter sp.]|nr:VWA domain-containing protein [Polaribacter sp.]